MSQVWTSALVGGASRECDYALVIAGWETVYTVSGRYTLPATAANGLSTSAGFLPETKPLASRPRISTAGASRPESGEMSTSALQVELLASPGSSVGELVSRERFRGDAAGFLRSHLYSAIDSVQDLPVAWDAPFSEGGGFAFVGTECIHYDAVVPSSGPHEPTILSNCSRGQRLTAAAPHASQAVVYPFMPSLHWRTGVLFKGIRGLALEYWLPAFGGVISGISSHGNRIGITFSGTTWLADADDEQVLISADLLRGAIVAPNAAAAADGSEGSLKVYFDDWHRGIGNGHYVLQFAGNWFGIEETS